MSLIEKIRRQAEKSKLWSVEHLGSGQSEYAPEMTLCSIIFDEGAKPLAHFVDVRNDAAEVFLSVTKSFGPLNINSLSNEHLAQAILSVDSASQSAILDKVANLMSPDRKHIFEQALTKHKGLSNKLGSLASLFEETFGVSLSSRSTTALAVGPKLGM